MSKTEGLVEEIALTYDGESYSIVIVGWGASDSDALNLQLRTDTGKILSQRVDFIPRYEIRQELNEDKKQYKTILGFTLKAVMDKASRTFFLYLNDKKLQKIKRSTLEKIYKTSEQRIDVEEYKKKNGLIYIKGWGYHMYLPFEIKVYDEEGHPLDAEIATSRRVDVERHFHLENKNRISYGFMITLPQSSLKSDRLRLALSTEKKTVSKDIDLSRECVSSIENTDLIHKLLSPRKWIKGVRYLKRRGVRAFIGKLSRVNETYDDKYRRWFLSQRVTAEELKRQSKVTFVKNPKISIVIPLYNTKLPFLKAVIDSVLNQSYCNWELCLADGSTDNSVGGYISDNYNDKRIIYKRLEKNEGIAGNTNAALDMATGDFIALCDHDDILEPDALFEIVKYYNENPDTDIIYTDEDLTDESGDKFVSPRFKPDYNPDMLNSINYICHLFVVKKSIIDEVGGFGSEYDGAQDWDMILRCCEKAKGIGHIPKILYHWRAYEESTAGNADSKEYAIEAGRRAVADHLKRIGLNGELEYTDVFVLFRVKLIPKGHPLISIIIPNKDERDTLQTCVESIEAKSTYDNYEIIIVENNSENDETFEFYKELENKYSNIRVVYYEGGFNYSKINNFGAGYAKGEYYILLNNDTEVITPDWMECMLGYCERENTGIVGAKLYYTDDTVQHCGAVIGIGGFAGHIQTLASANDAGYFGRLKVAQDLSAVTAACMMIKKSVYEKVGGLDEDYTVSLNDMDLCLKVRSLGLLVALDPGVELYHYESKSRGLEMSAEKHERFKREISRFRSKWADIIRDGDPYYNPNLTLTRGDCTLRDMDEHFDIIEEINGEAV